MRSVKKPHGYPRSLHRPSRRWTPRRTGLALVITAALVCGIQAGAQPPDDSQWPAYGRTQAGTRYSPLDLIDRGNVAGLRRVWMYRTGELGQDARDGDELTFEATPIHFGGRLYVSTAFGAVLALDPATGAELWRYDAKVPRGRSYAEVTSRGVSSWRDASAPPGAPCRDRIFLATIDARLAALDAADGRPCADFGRQGQVDLADAVGMQGNGDYCVTSPPAVVGGVVVVGSAIGDNWSANTGSGVVRGFDARTGRQRWRWSPLAGLGVDDPVGAANAWSTISGDPERGLVFVPTSSPSPDFYGGLRKGVDRDANSVVALRAATGERVWAFQTVHHDLWDYDVAAQPTLVTLTREGRDLEAVAQLTKMGFLFVLDRQTGRPLFPVEERPVPQGAVPGEWPSPTQPFPRVPEPLLSLVPLTVSNVWGLNETEREGCRRLIAGARSEGIYTPPALEGTVMLPGNSAGTNWGNAAFAADPRLLIFALNRFATLVQLIPRDDFEASRRQARLDGSRFSYGSQRGARFGMRRAMVMSPGFIPCNPPPWGELVAVSLKKGAVLWRSPVGGPPDDHPMGAALKAAGVRGFPIIGGPIVTAGGLVFVAGVEDRKLRAFDMDTGGELWAGDLPRAGAATPMTYEVGGRQYVVIAAGGHGKAGWELGDFVVAFALPGD